MQSTQCLLEDEKARAARCNLIQQLGDDGFQDGLRTCNSCTFGMPKKLGIHLHMQLKSVHDILVSIEAMISELSVRKSKL